MEKRILVAIDDSIHSKKAIEYAVKMRSVVTDLSYALFSVQPTISEYLVHDSNIDAKARSA
ncbi:MAG: universal stress protein, partial [Deltaproteobacteria bacterium]|nr:universal stress protein [Deltaproteobacteria bacterium]